MDRRSIDSALRKKGFSIDDSRDHTFYHHKFNGKITGINTKISRGSNYKRIDASLQSMIKKQLKLDTSQEFKNLIDCPMTKDDYIKKLKGKGLLESTA